MSSEQQRTALWVHGYGVHPDFEKLSLAAKTTAQEQGTNVVIPALTDYDGKHLVVLPLEQQAERLHLANVEEATDIICHSQGGLVLALYALKRSGLPLESRVTLVAPPLTSPKNRILENLLDPQPDEEIAASDYGGARGVKRWVNKAGKDQSLVVTNGYAGEVEDSTFDAFGLIASIVTKVPVTRIIKPDKDERFGSLVNEYDQLRTVAPDAHIEIARRASHTFRGCESALARAALFGTRFNKQEPYVSIA